MSIHELQAALRALDEAESVECEIGCESWALPIARLAVIAAARRVAEGAGEPVAWLCVEESSGAKDATSNPRVRRNYESFGRTITPLYTTPPSADALVEALVKLIEKWRAPTGMYEGYDETREQCAAELDAAQAQGVGRG